MVLRNLIRAAVASVEAVGKAFGRAVQEQVKAAEQAGARQTERTGGTASDTKAAVNANAKLGISLQESIQILNVSEPLNYEEVIKKYDHLFAINDKDKGGSFYLQSKVYRARERIDEELRRSGRLPEQKPSDVDTAR